MSAKSQVLVVDDEADIRELLGMTLARMGLDAHCASSTTEAYALLARNSYDLCLTDMRLPDGDGLTVVDYVAKNHPHLPVAGMTAPRSRPAPSTISPSRSRSTSSASWCARR